MAQRYVNAAEVLPPEVLAAVMKAVQNRSCFMWVPMPKNANRQNRAAYVVRLADEGYSAAAIADRLFISERTVFRILAKERKRR